MSVIEALQARQETLIDALAHDQFLTAAEADEIIAELAEIDAELQKQMEFVSDWGEARKQVLTYGVPL